MVEIPINYHEFLQMQVISLYFFLSMIIIILSHGEFTFWNIAHGTKILLKEYYECLDCFFFIQDKISN